METRFPTRSAPFPTSGDPTGPYGNGYRTRWDTRVDTIELKIPKVMSSGT